MKCITLLIILFFSFTFISAASNSTLEEQAKTCLQDSKLIVQDLEKNAFSIERANDTLTQAKSVYDAQIINKQRGKDDFSLVIKYCDQLKSLKSLAYSSKDEFDSLKKFYAESINDDMDTSSIEEALSKIDLEIRSERYEKVDEIVQDTYQQIIDLQSEYSALNTFKRNTQNFFIRIFTENWKFKLGLITVLLALYFLFRDSIKKKILESKINSLEIKKKTLKELIKKTQKNYFEEGQVSEGTYNIRTRKFAELIRDIDREIPLLEEELAKIKKIKRGKK